MSYSPPPPESAAGKLDHRAQSLARCLESAGLRLVLAESCTAGLVSGVLGGVPGASRWLCGSAVVYQAETKKSWLAIPGDLIEELGTVAPRISDILAKNVLKSTPQANLAAAVTGHLGPEAPHKMDGVIYIAIRFRDGRCQSAHCQLPAGTGSATQKRRFRQRLCAAFVLDRIQAACDVEFEEQTPHRP